jgi:hypothetical protein
MNSPTLANDTWVGRLPVDRASQSEKAPKRQAAVLFALFSAKELHNIS